MSETVQPSTAHEERAFQKLSRIPIKIEVSQTRLPKPAWIRTKVADAQTLSKVKHMLRDKKLTTVCEEASCPNLAECFSQGTATFMIMGDKCTRRCSFCDVGHGRPDPLDSNEPKNLAETILKMNLNYVVITSVDRDDLRDGGASHFVACIQEIRQSSPNIKIEILVPDFRGRVPVALEILAEAPPEIFNHNIETISRLYKQARPGSNYEGSLQLLLAHKKSFPHIPTKSGIMLGLGEESEEIIQVLKDLRAHEVDMLTIGQYLQPSRFHLPVTRYASLEEFAELSKLAKEMGFTRVASGPMVRSSYHADKQALGTFTS